MDVFNHPESAMQFSAFGPGPSNLFQSSSSMQQSKSTTLDQSDDSSTAVSSASSMDDGIAAPKSAAEMLDIMNNAGKAAPVAVATRQLTDEELDRQVTLVLSETETIWLLDVPSSSVNLDSNEAPAVRAANARYTEVNSDTY
jgi:hypothetical protein